MQRLRVNFSLSGQCELQIRAGDEELADDLIQQLEDGYPPEWLKTLIINGLDFENLNVDSHHILGMEPAPEEELVFDWD